MVTPSSVQFLSTPSDKTEFVHNFLNILKLSNYYDDSIENKNLEWLLDVENAGELVTWLCSYIGPENVLQEEEVNEYLELKAEGTPDTSVLNQSQLNDVTFSSDEVTYESVASIEEEILELDTFIAVINNQDETLRPKYKSVQDDLLKQRESSVSMQLQVQKAELACTKTSKKLDMARAKFMECYQSLNDGLSNSHSDQSEHRIELLSHIMPIKDIMAKYNRCGQHIDFITSRNNLQQEMPSGINELSDQFNTGKNKTILKKTLQKIIFCKERIVEARNKCLLASLEKEENVAAVDCIRLIVNDIQTGRANKSTNIRWRNKLRIELANLQDRLEDLQQNSPGSELINAVAHFMDASITKIFHKLSEKTKRHQCNSFECRKMLLNCIEARVHHCHLLFVLLVEEKQKLNDVVQLIHEYAEPLTEELQQSTRRIEKMKIIRSGQVPKLQDGQELSERDSLQEMLLSLAPATSSDEDKHLLDAYKRLDESIRSDEQTLLHTSFQAMEETLTKNEQALQELVKLLFSGSTKKPMIVDLDLSCQLYDTGLLVERLKKSLKDLAAEYEITVKNMSNPHVKRRRLLWVYFLTECEKINVLIKYMENELRKQGASDSL